MTLEKITQLKEQYHFHRENFNSNDEDIKYLNNLKHKLYKAIRKRLKFLWKESVKNGNIPEISISVNPEGVDVCDLDIIYNFGDESYNISYSDLCGYTSIDVGYFPKVQYDNVDTVEKKFMPLYIKLK